MARKRFWYVIPITIGILVIGLIAGSLLLFIHVNSKSGIQPTSTSQTSNGINGIPSHAATATALATAAGHGPNATPTPIRSTTGMRLIIASIGVNAPVEPVGVASNGTLATPTANEWTGVGLYTDGSYPGASGSAVMDGHLNRPGGCCIPAVFWNLKFLHIGAEVDVVVPSGKTVRFLVYAIKTLANNASTANIFHGANGSYLNLITCSGTWLSSQHQTTTRLVVYTVLA